MIESEDVCHLHTRSEQPLCAHGKVVASHVNETVSACNAHLTCPHVTPHTHAFAPAANCTAHVHIQYISCAPLTTEWSTLAHVGVWTRVQFLRDDVPTALRAGEVHYSRVPVEYWDDRLARLRAMGLNSIQTYVCVLLTVHEASSTCIVLS